MLHLHHSPHQDGVAQLLRARVEQLLDRTSDAASLAIVAHTVGAVRRAALLPSGALAVGDGDCVLAQ